MPWLLPGVAVLALAGLTGCGDSGGDGAGRHVSVHRYQVTQPVTTLLLRSGSGSVDVTGGSGPISVQETLTFSGSPPSTRHQVQGDSLTLDHGGCPGSGVRICGVSYRVEVPTATTVRITTDNGTVDVRGLSGALSLNTGAGMVQASDLRSPTVDVRSGAGSVTLRFAAPPRDVRVRTTVGSVGVYLPGGVAYTVDAHAAVGRSKISVAQQPDSTHRITAGSDVGEVTVAPA